MNKYDVFISYRRTSFESANLIATRLKAAGYTVFFDLETLRSGKFNEQLFDKIESCKDFILVLPPNALDRCVDDDDWVRLEVCKAMECGKNIIPVMLNGFSWPNPMPKGMEELQNYQALTANSIEYFDLSIERLQNKYLKSKKHARITKGVKLTALAIASLMIVIAMAYGVLHFLSLNVCEKYATILTNDAASIHAIVEEHYKLKNEWDDFFDDIKHETNSDKMLSLQENIINRITFTEKQISNTWNTDTVAIKINDWHSFLLSLHGINSEEISLSPVNATIYYQDYINQLLTMADAALEPSSLNLKIANLINEAFPHTINAYYAALLSEISNFPESSRKIFVNLSSKWIYYPQHYKLGEDQKYYDNISSAEFKKYEELVEHLSVIMMKAE